MAIVSVPRAWGCGIFLLLTAIQVEAAPEPVTRLKWVLIVSPTDLTPKARAGLLASVSVHTDTARWEPVQVQRGDTLYALIAKQYGYAIQGQAAEAKAVARVIQGANGLPRVDALGEGQQLRFPVLPRKPATTAKPSTGQVFDLGSVQLSYADFQRCRLRDAPTCEPSTSPSTGRAWVLTGELSDLDAVLTAVKAAEPSGATDRAIYFGPSPESIRIDIPSAAEAPADATTADGETLGVAPEISSLCAKLAPAHAGHLFLLDFFGQDGGCGHGRKVQEVTRIVLDQLGAGALASRIVPVELSFYPFNSRALRILDAYIEKFRPEVAGVLRGFRKSLTDEYEHNSDRHLIPILFLVALYDDLLNADDGAVLSSSFFTTADPFKVLPSSYGRDSRNVILSAVLNDPGSIESARYEPQRTFWELRRDYGLVLVGSYTSGPKPYGTQSKDGDGVTCLARGDGYAGSCVTPSDRGTSFATPAIASMLLVAETFWRGHGEQLLGSEARRRLLLASRPSLAFEHYASMGVPRINRLLLMAGTYAVTGKPMPVSVADLRGNVKYRIRDREFSRPFGRGEIAGIQFGTTADFVFLDDQQRWQPAKIEELKLSTTNGPFNPTQFDKLEALLAL